MTRPTCSVLIPSFRRPGQLITCLGALARQTVPPDEVLVVWQADDTPTRDAVVGLRVPYRLDVLHAPEPGVVPAENLALDRATGEVIALIDDDAIPGPDWLERHLRLYADPAVGAVGGPADNYLPDGTPFPRRAVGPVGRLTWYGKMHGNMHTQAVEWQTRPPTPVDHLVGYNMTIRRAAFDRFEAGLRRYWQLFELDACLQVRARGYTVLFDYGNVVAHHPTNTAYAGGRDGDLQVKVYNAGYNLAFVLAKHSPARLRLPRLGYLLLVGSVGVPGLAGAAVAWRRFGNLGRELGVLARTWAATVAGWRAGTRVSRRPAAGKR